MDATVILYLSANADPTASKLFRNALESFDGTTDDGAALVNAAMSMRGYKPTAIVAPFKNDNETDAGILDRIWTRFQNSATEKWTDSAGILPLGGNKRRSMMVGDVAIRGVRVFLRARQGWLDITPSLIALRGYDYKAAIVNGLDIARKFEGS